MSKQDIQFTVSEDEAYLIFGCLGLQAEDPEPLPEEDVSRLHQLRDELIEQFHEQVPWG